MNFILNLIWLLLGGLHTALLWMVASILMFITIIGIPWGRATFNIGLMILWPFGAKAVSRKTTSGDDVGTGFLGLLGNVIWFLLAGLWLFLCHVVLAIFFTLTIIGIPFAVQHWKLAKISLAPIGKAIVWE